MKATPIQLRTRADLARLVPPDGLIIELGVAAGKFAREMLDANPLARYTGIDRWNDHHDEAEMREANQRLIEWERVCLLRSTFAEAVDKFPNEHADLIYVDGYAHTGQDGGQTLRDWWPKVKRGGIFAGHDYCAEYQPTVDAVDAFVAEHGLDLHIIDDGPHPSWWIRKF